MPIDKRAVLLDLHVMMHFRLFGRCYWLADREACDALSRKLDDLGLQERVSGDEDTSTKRPLGNELPLDLIMVFLGLWDEWEMPNILERHGLIDEIDESRIYDLLASSRDPERVLRPIVRKAFRDHFHPSALLV